MSRGPFFAIQDEDIAKGRPQGKQVGPGGPQVVGKHPPDLGHVLNHVKALNPDTKLVFYSIQYFDRGPFFKSICISRPGRC